MRRFFFSLIETCLLVALCGCATTRSIKLGRSKFYQGKTREASSAMEQAREVRGRDRLLFLMERGLIHQYAGRYEESSRDFLDAIKLSSESELVDISQQAQSFLSSDRSLFYQGEPHELVLLHSYCAINFLKMRKWEDALVECKRALKKQERFPFLFNRQPFTNYLAGLCFEIMGDEADASIEYKKVLSMRKEVSFVKRGSSRQGEVICFIQIGKSPVKRPISFSISPDEYLIIPEYKSRPSIAKGASILVDGRQFASSYLLTDIGEAAVYTLKERAGKEIARVSARLAIKREISRKVRKKAGMEIGSLTQAFLLFSESADVRCWETLPETLHIARFSLSPGRYNITIQFQDKNGSPTLDVNYKDTEIKSGGKVFLISRCIQ